MTDPVRTRIELADEAATEVLGAALRAFGREVGDDVMVLLRGDLGAGKTTLVRGFLRGAGHRGSVKSPTYTLVEPYRIDALQVYHFDLYRVVDPEELEDIGFRDYLAESAWRFVEWPERAGDLLPLADLVVELRVAGEGRTATVEAVSERARAWLAHWPGVREARLRG
jgi:tRNA threonylcarbamoyladenosine biosynthesis protein TsaE